MDNVPDDPFKDNAAKPVVPPPPPLPAKQEVKVETAKPAVVPQTSSKEVVIRTMKNDLDEIRSQPARSEQAAAPVKQVAPQQSVDIAPSKNILADNNASASSQKVVSMPVKNSRKSPALKILAMVVAVLAIIGAGVSAAFYFGLVTLPMGIEQPSASPSVVLGELSDVIPQSASLITEYNISSEDKRANIINAWNAQGENTPSLITLLAGDPRTLLSDYPSVKKFAYVVLPGDSRPFIVVPKDTDTERLFTESLKGRFIEKNGWYIGHAISAIAYESALSQGIINDDILKQPFSNALRIIIEQDALSGMVQTALGSAYAPVSSNKIALYTDMQLSGSTISFQGFADPVVSANSAQPIANKNLMTNYVPYDADYIKFGSNLAGDSGVIMEKSTLIDATIAQKPAVKQLLSSLNQSYVYYTRVGVDGVKDMGIIITLPETLKNSLKNGDPALEEALFMIAPMITGQRQQATLAFSDGLFNEIPLRYVNITGQDRALDYTVQNGMVIISTSKEGIFASLNESSGAVTESVGGLKSLIARSSVQAGQAASYGSIGATLIGSFIPMQPESKVLYEISTGVKGNNQLNTLSGVLSY